MSDFTRARNEEGKQVMQCQSSAHARAYTHSSPVAWLGHAHDKSIPEIARDQALAALPRMSLFRAAVVPRLVGCPLLSV